MQRLSTKSVCSELPFFARTEIIYILAAVTSVLLSLWINTQNTVLNPDAICYLQSAETFSHQDLSAAMSLCGQSKWPFYYLLIAGFTNITSLSYINSAIIINSFFSVLSVLLFIRIVAFFSNKKSILWFAALVILLFHEGNVLKPDIIRDHGFWCFYLVSIFFLLAFVQNKKLSQAILWSTSLIVATLFRIEGIFFLIALPFIMLFENNVSWISRFKNFLYLYSVLLLMSLVVLGIVMRHPDISLGRLNELQTFFTYSHLYQSIAPQLAITDWLGNHIFILDARDKYPVYFSMLISWYICLLISAISLIYFALTIFAWHKKLLPSLKNSRLVLWGYIAINVSITFIFLLQNFFVSKRYLLALALTLMLWIPFSLEYLFKQWRQKKWPLILVVFFIAVYGVGGIVHFSDSKQYIRDAGDWLNLHTAKKSSLYSNDYQVMYYSHHFGNQIFSNRDQFADFNTLQNYQWHQYDYLALHLNNKTLISQADLLNQLKNLPVVIFKGKHNDDQVRIYANKKDYQ